MTLSEVVVTYNETTNRSPAQWDVGSLHEDESVNSKYHSTPRVYLDEKALAYQPVQAYQESVFGKLGRSTVGTVISQNSPFPDLILGWPWSDSADQPGEVKDTKVRFSPNPLEKLPIHDLLESLGNVVTIRTFDGSAMDVTRQMTDIDADYLPNEPKVRARASVNAVGQSIAEVLTKMVPSTRFMYNVSSDPSDSPSEAGATGQVGVLSTIMGSLQRNLMQMPGGSVRFITRKTADVIPATPPREPEIPVEAPFHPIVQSFAEGFEGVCPSAVTLETANRIVETAIQKTSEREIEVDDTDGSLSFELRLDRGLLVVGELSLAGNLHANVYNDQHPDASAGLEDIWVKHLPQASVEDLIALF